MVTRGRAAVTLTVTATLVVAAGAGAYAVLDARRTPGIDCGRFRFDSSEWKRGRQHPVVGPYGPSAPGNDRFTRNQVAAHGLVKCGLLEGKTKRDVNTLLGRWDGEAYDEQYWSYAVGRGHDLLGASSHTEQSLYMEFDERGAVRDARIVSRRM
ncbi:MAG TPA: hypothetical protein VK631_11440 [Solirubrobacteraceae bacterium]|nr:hypothetical protein [Solirubrobacteraceae bacterium]